MQPSWKKLENECGYPFYYNESTQQKQWDHPRFIEVKHLIDDCNYVKYSKYRVALKFRALQKALFMENVNLNTVIGVFTKHRLGTNESSLCLESYDLEAVLYDIYFAANKQSGKSIDIDFAVELMQNFLYNIYDKERQVKIQVSAAKLVLVLLSEGELSELYNILFNLCADHNNCVTRLRLQSLLAKFVDLSIFMHEDVNFGQHLINSTIEHCFSNSPGLVGLCESNFVAWLEEEPQLLCWIPILSRIRSCEMVVHNAKCITCKASPLLGLMYKCVKCSKYTQCQKCFFIGKVNNSHKLTHSMREYSTTEVASSREFTFNFIKKICGLLQCSVKMNETEIRMVEAAKPRNSDKDLLLKSSASNKDFYSNIQTLSSPQNQLQLIIRQLELQNRELHRILIFGTYNEFEIRKYLEEHKSEVASQIHKLKLLKELLHNGRQSFKSCPVESTPRVGLVKPPKRMELEKMLSPIVQFSEYSDRNKDESHSSVPYSINDLSTWIKDQPTNSKRDDVDHVPVKESHNDLDDALAKLQQILANNFTLDESLGNIDNSHLKYAVSEVEGMLTSIIDNVESSRASPAQPYKS